MNETNAREVMEVARRVTAALNASLIAVRDSDTTEAFEAYRWAIGQVLGEVHFQLIAPTVQDRPELWTALEGRDVRPPLPLVEAPADPFVARILAAAAAAAAPGAPLEFPGSDEDAATITALCRDFSVRLAAAAEAACRGAPAHRASAFRRRVTYAITRLQMDLVHPSRLADDEQP